MKFFLLFMLLFTSIAVSAQTKPCNLNDGQLHLAYVFTDNRNLTMQALFGQETSPATVLIQYVSTSEQKERIDSLCLAGKTEGAVFIFPDEDVSKTIRYCNAEEYRTSLIKK
jgi:hypothetical protein